MTMKEYPVLFNGEMVRAILNGQKTQTRRAIKRPPTWSKCCPFGIVGDQLWVRETWGHDAQSIEDCKAAYEDVMSGFTCGPYYLATESAPETLRWKPSIHMPRWASRIQLEITDIRVERLQDISEEDAKAEGVMQLDAESFERPMEQDKNGLKLCPTCAGTGLHSALGANGGVICDVDCTDCDTHAKLFKHLWNSTGGDWDANPYVWVIEFRRIK